VSGQHIWVLTSEYTSDYDQHGEYFVAAFAKKPAIHDVADFLGEHYSSVPSLVKAASLLLDKGCSRIGQEPVILHLKREELK
jgi:hypothetical protein